MSMGVMESIFMVIYGLLFILLFVNFPCFGCT